MQENTIKQVKGINKIVQDLEMEMEMKAIKKTQTEAILKIKNIGKGTETTHIIITN